MSKVGDVEFGGDRKSQGDFTIDRAMRRCDMRFGRPSPEALQLATDAIRRRCLLPETMQHPVVKSECISLAYLIQAYGLPPCGSMIPPLGRCG